MVLFTWCITRRESWCERAQRTTGSGSEKTVQEPVSSIFARKSRISDRALIAHVTKDRYLSGFCMVAVARRGGRTKANRSGSLSLCHGKLLVYENYFTERV